MESRENPNAPIEGAEGDSAVGVEEKTPDTESSGGGGKDKAKEGTTTATRKPAVDAVSEEASPRMKESDRGPGGMGGPVIEDEALQTTRDTKTLAEGEEKQAAVPVKPLSAEERAKADRLEKEKVPQSNR